VFSVFCAFLRFNCFHLSVDFTCCDYLLCDVRIGARVYTCSFSFACVCDLIALPLLYLIVFIICYLCIIGALLVYYRCIYSSAVFRFDLFSSYALQMVLQVVFRVVFVLLSGFGWS
jgi:hypothetical protein